MFSRRFQGGGVDLRAGISFSSPAGQIHVDGAGERRRHAMLRFLRGKTNFHVRSEFGAGFNDPRRPSATDASSYVQAGGQRPR